ncbi:MAG TPA: hypothetical protein VLB44_11720 [Kofleriaceae bacterium]|nr:hypothetical protein [Kofleriaceae bacterium]
MGRLACVTVAVLLVACRDDHPVYSGTVTAGPLVVDGYVYFAAYDTSGHLPIYRASIETGDVEMRVTNRSYVYSLAAGLGQLYWIAALDDGSGLGVFSMALESREPIQLATLPDVQDRPVLVADGGMVYLKNGVEIDQVHPGGGALQPLFAASAHVAHVAVDQQVVYFTTDGPPGSLKRLTATGASDVATVDGFVGGSFAIRGGVAFLAATSGVTRVDLTAGTVDQIRGDATSSTYASADATYAITGTLDAQSLVQVGDVFSPVASGYSRIRGVAFVPGRAYIGEAESLDDVDLP